MKTIELFAGTKSFSKVMAKHGHETFTIDNDPTLEPDLCISIHDFKYGGGQMDVLWASPPCTTFSVASISHYWTEGKPKNQKALDGIRILKKTIELIKEIQPKYWFIENPRGMMRKVIDDIFKEVGITDYKRNTVSYCQYGSKIMKPTDIWTNLKDWKGKFCKNGSPCHERAGRGSKTGVQGIYNLEWEKARGVVPPELFEELMLYFL